MSESYCIHSQRINDFLDQHFANIRAPFTAGFELTAKCNLNCVHCYAKCDRNHKDFTADEFKVLFDQLIDRGLMEVYFTGGEIFTRPDFEKLYIYAKKKGIILVLLSNITLLNQRHVDLFKEYPVENISTTMYGYSEETYERVTGVKGSYGMFMRALELIQKNDLPYELKFVTLNENQEDLYKVREFGKKLGVEMVISTGIHPESNGLKDPMDSRLSAKEAFEFDWKDPDRRAFWREVGKQLLSGEIDLIPERAKERFSQGYLYPCSIAHQHVFITSDLHLQGCVRASFKRYDLRKGNIDDGWDFLQKEFLTKKASPNFLCMHCEDIRFCEQCTANFAQVTGDEEKPDEFYCQIAKLRHQMVDQDMRELMNDSVQC